MRSTVTTLLSNNFFSMMLLILLFMSAVLFSDKIILKTIYKKHNLAFYILSMTVTIPMYLLIYHCNKTIIDNGFYLIKELDVIATAFSGLIGLIISIVFYLRNKQEKMRLHAIIYFGICLVFRTPALFI